jgi:hypothetical protein
MRRFVSVSRPTQLPLSQNQTDPSQAKTPSSAGHSRNSTESPRFRSSKLSPTFYLIINLIINTVGVHEFLFALQSHKAPECLECRIVTRVQTDLREEFII